MNREQGLKKKNSGFRMSAVDAVLLLVIVGVVAVLLYLVTSDRVELVSSSEEITVSYQVEVIGLREQWQGLAAIGDSVMDLETGQEIGKIVNVTYTSYQRVGTNADTEQLVYTAIPGYINMTLTIESSAVRKEDRYVIGNWTLAVGKELAFRAPALTRSGYCTVIEEKGAAER